MMQDPRLLASVRDWLEAWGDEVAAVELGVARHRFDPDVVAFGTHADIVHSIDALHDEQWTAVWPTIEQFAFRLDDLVVLASPDGQQAVAIVGWDSVGIATDGTTFDRPGRATIVLRREGDDWIAVHTHFSLGRDVPSRSHGARSPR